MSGPGKFYDVFMRDQLAATRARARNRLSSAGDCQVCGRWAPKRYGGMGRYPAMCIDCWTSSEPPSLGPTNG